MTEKKPFVRKPTLRNGQWCVVIADKAGPLATELEVIECTSQETAFQAYRNAKKSQGKML